MIVWFWARIAYCCDGVWAAFSGWEIEAATSSVFMRKKDISKLHRTTSSSLLETRIFATVLFRLSTWIWERSLSIFFWFLLQSAGGCRVVWTNAARSLYDERFRCCHWYWLWLLIGLGFWAYIERGVVIWWVALLVVGQIKSIMLLIWDALDDIRRAKLGGHFGRLGIKLYTEIYCVFHLSCLFFFCLLLCIVSRLRNEMGMDSTSIYLKMIIPTRPETRSCYFSRTEHEAIQL